MHVGELPYKQKSPLEKNDHPKLDTSPLLDEEGIAHYQSMVGSMQWLVTLARFDIATAMMTLSCYQAAPRQRHLDRMKCLYGYVRDRPDAAIRVRTGMPNYSKFEPVPEYN